MVLKAENKLIMRNVRFARNTLERTKGLMFEEKKKFNYALVFEFPIESRVGTSLHMLFVFFPIDVLFWIKTKKWWIRQLLNHLSQITLQKKQPNM